MKLYIFLFNTYDIYFHFIILEFQTKRKRENYNEIVISIIIL